VTEGASTTAPELYPSIDIRDGNVVRLRQGDFADETVYGDDPVAVARSFEAAGAHWIHVVDLDASRTGEPANFDAVARICTSVRTRVQAGGGVRSAEAAAKLLDRGVARIVLGTAALERPALVDELCAEHPGRVAVALDTRGRHVAVRGWTEDSGGDPFELVRRFEGSGVSALIVTRIDVDGTLAGPDLGMLESMLDATAVPVIASGGVGSLDDLHALARLDVRGRRLAGAIVGRAIYEGCFTVGDAMAAMAGPPPTRYGRA
jgi:phosphoribosylformimino-5-aminoimidazole carboxamide ribotide isomerase